MIKRYDDAYRVLPFINGSHRHNWISNSDYEQFDYNDNMAYENDSTAYSYNDVGVQATTNQYYGALQISNQSILWTDSNNQYLTRWDVAPWPGRNVVIGANTDFASKIYIGNGEIVYSGGPNNAIYRKNVWDDTVGTGTQITNTGSGGSPLCYIGGGEFVYRNGSDAKLWRKNAYEIGGAGTRITDTIGDSAQYLGAGVILYRRSPNLLHRVNAYAMNDGVNLTVGIDSFITINCTTILYKSSSNGYLYRKSPWDLSGGTAITNLFVTTGGIVYLGRNEILYLDGSLNLYRKNIMDSTGGNGKLIRSLYVINQFHLGNGVVYFQHSLDYSPGSFRYYRRKLW